ncbi:hypothetical protein VU05_01950 [Desulfobulbus sp. F1]|nr:hypothetical protein [Desulfobulbus sp. F1]
MAGKYVCLFFFFLCFLGFFSLPSENNSNDQEINAFNIKIPTQWFCFKKLLGIFVASPIVIYFVITWNQEFPFIGDHDFHLIENYKATLFWIDFKWQLLIFLLTFIFSIRFGIIKYWIPFAGIILIWWSRYDTLPWHHISHAFYIRYPAAGRFFSVPFMYFAILTNADQLYNFSRIVNIAILTAWIYLFRPFLFNRKPNLNLALFCLTFLCQTSVIYYFNTSYLEPLASIFLLLAVESLFVYSQKNNYVIACLLVGLAAMVKEQAILVLPWVLLAGKPWAWNIRQWTRGIIVGISSAVPFLVYYSVRMQRMDSGRNFKLITLDQLLDPERYLTLFGRLGYHLGGYGIVSVLLLSIFSCIAIIKYKEYRIAVLCIIGASLTQLVFFFTDANSSEYIGYFRFAFISLALIAGIILSAENVIETCSIKIMMVTIPLFFSAAYNLSFFFKDVYTNDLNRNFIEHSDAPVYLPISTLIKKAESQHLLNRGNRIYINDNTGYHINSAGIHYTRIATSYSIEINKLFKCGCDEDVDAVIVPFIYFSGMNIGLRESPQKYSPFAPPPQKMAESWCLSNSKKDQCYREMKETCSSVISETFNGDLVGLMGIKKSLK